MPVLPLIYGLDLLTSTEGSVINPAQDRIIAVGISTETGDEYYDGDEDEIITLVDRRLELLRDGVLATWNGSQLALPLLQARVTALGLDTGLAVFADNRRPTRGTNPPVVGVEHSYWGAWHGHTHLDLTRIYEQESRRWNPLRSRRATPESHFPATDELVQRDPCRDARLMRSLAERRWPQARRVLDRMPTGHAERVAIDHPPAAVSGR